MSLDFIEHRFDLPSLGVDHRQFLGWSLFGVQNGRDESVSFVRAGHGLFDHPHWDAFLPSPIVSRTWVDLA